MPENLTTMQKIETVKNLLDKLADAHGRAKCAYIYVIDEFINGIQNDVAALEKKVNGTKDETPQISVDAG